MQFYFLPGTRSKYSHHNLSMNPSQVNRFRGAIGIGPFLRPSATPQYLRRFLGAMVLGCSSPISLVAAKATHIFPFVALASANTTPNPSCRPIRFAYPEIDGNVTVIAPQKIGHTWCGVMWALTLKKLDPYSLIKASLFGLFLLYNAYR